MSKRALITGAAGFTGRHLAIALAKAGYAVTGLARRQPAVLPAGIDQMLLVDLAKDHSLLADALHDLKPDVIVHLAAISRIDHGDADTVYQINTLGSRHLLEAICQSGHKPQAVLMASSAYVYGTEGGIQNEDSPLCPPNDYAVSKIAMEHIARLYSSRLPVVIARPFNYTGIWQEGHFLIPKLIACIQRRDPVLHLGDVHAVRDFLDVRTLCDFYIRLMHSPMAAGQTVNVCSGNGLKLSTILDMLRGLAGYNFEIEVDRSLIRGGGNILTGDRRRLESIIGPSEGIPFETTLRWMLDEQESSTP